MTSKTRVTTSVDNPNIAILNELKQAGVELRVCGQGLMGKKVEPSQLLPGVQADLWAMTTMVNLQLKATSGSAVKSVPRLRT